MTAPAFLTGGGETGALMRGHDWSSSPLGNPAGWPPRLRSVVELLLGSKFPMFVAWGAELGFLYNDAYAEILGAKHPRALGARFHDIWAEIWPDILPLIEAAMAGVATYREDLPLLMNRRGFDEQTWFTFSYSPVRDEEGRVAGMYCAVAETTGRVLMERKQAFLVRLGDTLRGLNDPHALPTLAAELLGTELGADRAGYGIIDASGEVVSVERDWTAGRVASLAGEARILDAFGPAVIAELRAGRTLVVEDCQADPRTSRPAYLPTWDSIGTRALIVAPLIRSGRLAAILYVHSGGPRHWTGVEAELVEEAAGRTWDAVQRAWALADLRESEERLQLALDASGMVGLYDWLVPQDRLFADARFARLFGVDPDRAAAGAPLADFKRVIHPEDAARVEAAMKRTLETGEPYEAEYRLLRDGGEVHWVAARGRCLHDGGGMPKRFSGTVVDITDRKQAEERQALLSREVDHRAKNALSVVQAALRLTRAPDLPTYARAIEGRVAALARAQTLLADRQWSGADLLTLLRGELDGFLDRDGGGPQAEVDGPPVSLPAGAAQPLAMAIHELATNAVKYGALSAPEGRVEVNWTVEGGLPDRLRLRWTERGGPALKKSPERRGFGTRVLDGTVRGQLGGTLSLGWRPSGLVCELDVPLRPGPPPGDGEVDAAPV
ncbi:PAS domain-containing sensor histidine kinase [Roseomonas populi]|uniref:histidine kinase n=1 Tax=Roseomonas populi TaxID=3121582 RepID=A0ABT1X6K2_9PROT|nr:PAS domain-containing protein [Roseomonas pecuniae]MCR0983735.1 PAS domain-containing protein [Roseomonas pecuniae]